MTQTPLTLPCMAPPPDQTLPPATPPPVPKQPVAPSPGTCDALHFDPTLCSGVGNPYLPQPSNLTPPPEQCTIAATAIYVDCNNGGGGNGTQASPYGSLAQAQAAVQSGGTVIFSGTCNLTSDLNLVAGETLEGLCGQTDVINGNDTYNVIINGVNNVSIYNATFNALGANGGLGGEGGIIIYNSSGDSIRWNTLTNCDYSCISTENLSSSVIDSNTINGSTNPQNADVNPGAWLNGYAININDIGGESGGAADAGNLVSNNFIENFLQGGITFYGNNNNITGNVIVNSGRQLEDGGAIYSSQYPLGNTPPPETGDAITNNTILNFGGYVPPQNPEAPSSGVPLTGHGIYLDDGVGSLVISGNIVQDIGGTDLFIHGGSNITITGNVLDGSQAETLAYIGSPASSGCTGNSLTDNIMYSSGAWTVSAWGDGIFDDTPAGFNCNNPPSFSGNDYYSTTGAPPPFSTSGNGYFVGLADPNPLLTNPGYNPSTGTVSNPPPGFQPLTTNRGPSINPICSTTNCPGG
jgi:hypothetical protein